MCLELFSYKYCITALIWNNLNMCVFLVHWHRISKLTAGCLKGVTECFLKPPGSVTACAHWQRKALPSWSQTSTNYWTLPFHSGFRQQSEVFTFFPIIKWIYLIMGKSDQLRYYYSLCCTVDSKRRGVSTEKHYKPLPSRSSLSQGVNHMQWPDDSRYMGTRWPGLASILLWKQVIPIA